MATKLVTRGVLLPPASHHDRSPRPSPPRKEIREIKNNEVQWQIFLLGLLNFQEADAINEDRGEKWKSYYRIAGIHGMPYEAYNGVDSKAMHPKLASNTQHGGYCMHSSTLFATWHRPYLALFEQELYEHVQDAAMILGHANAFKDFRLPYWDWTIGAKPEDCYPDFFIQKEVTLTIGSQPRTIRNPLASFSTDPKRSPKYKGPPIPKAGLSTTETTRDTPENIRNSLWSSRKGRLQYISLLLNGGVTSFNNFSTNKYLSKNPGSWPSLESIHDEVHGDIGGDRGHMGYQVVSAFDPIFWLHHCNVDRILSLRQAAFPTQKLEPTTISSRSLEKNPRTTFEGEVINEDTALWPFYNNSLEFWTSKGIADPTSSLGYSYDTIPASTTPRRARQVAQQVFPDISAMTVSLKPVSKRIAADAGLAASAPAPAVTTKTSSPLLDADNSYDNWSFNVRVIKHGLGSVFTVLAFIDEHFDRAAAPDTWRNTAVGSVEVLGRDLGTSCSKCQEDIQDDLVITGVVVLTPSLVDHMRRGDLASLRPDDVVPYLKKNLHWRVVSAGPAEQIGFSDVRREDVPGLTVLVSSNKVTVDPTDGVPDFSPDHVVYREITEGRPGGLGPDDQF